MAIFAVSRQAVVDSWEKWLPFLLLWFGAQWLVFQLGKLDSLARFFATHIIRWSADARLVGSLRWIFGKTAVACALVERSSHDIEMGNSAAAIKLINSALEYRPDIGHFYGWRGIARYNEGDWEAAIEDISTGLELQPDVDFPRVYRGYCYVQLQQFNEAIEDLAEHECDTADDWQIAFWRGRAYEEVGNWPEAIAGYELAHRLDQSQVDPICAVSLIQSACPNPAFRDGCKALENATLACACTNWKEWIPLSCLAAAYAEKGEFEIAVSYAEQSLGLAPDDDKPERQFRLEQFRDHIPFRFTDRGRLERSPEMLARRDDWSRQDD